MAERWEVSRLDSRQVQIFFLNHNPQDFSGSLTIGIKKNVSYLTPSTQRWEILKLYVDLVNEAKLVHNFS